MNNWIYYTLYTFIINWFYMMNNTIIEYYIDLYSYPFIVSTYSLGLITIYNLITQTPTYYIQNISNISDNAIYYSNTFSTYSLLIINGICISVSNILYVHSVRSYKNNLSILITLHKSDVLITTIVSSIWFNGYFNPGGVVLIVILLTSFNRSILNNHAYSQININDENTIDEPLIYDFIKYSVKPISFVSLSAILNTLSNLTSLYLIKINIPICTIIQYQFTSMTIVYITNKHLMFNSIKLIYNNIPENDTLNSTNYNNHNMIVFATIVAPVFSVLYYSILYITYNSYSNIGYIKSILLINPLIYNNINRFFNSPSESDGQSKYYNCISLSSIIGIGIIEYYNDNS